MKIIITAGGQGTKLWPYSRQDKPKQFQPIIGDKSSYQQNVEVLLKQYAPEDIFISTKRKFIRYVSEQSPQIPLRNYIVEPDIARDRGPGEGLAFLKLSMLHPDEVFFLIQADCLREPEDKFLKMMEQSEALVSERKCFLTGGIKATEPTMGIDYLKLGEKIKGSSDTFVIDEFMVRRKTTHETRELIKNFHVVAHCNHTCWYPGLMLEAYKKYRPDWYDILMEIKEVIDQPGENEAIERLYATMEAGATEEVTRKVMSEGGSVATLLPFKWTDVGTWGSVYDFFEHGKQNYLGGNVISVDTTGSLIKTNSISKVIAVAGVDNLIVVDTEDALLIVPKDKIEKIKDLQAILKERDETEYL